MVKGSARKAQVRPRTVTRMRWIAWLALLVVAIPAAHAQETGPNLTLVGVTLTGAIPYQAVAMMAVDWRYELPSPGAATALGNTTIAWSLSCPGNQFALAHSVSTAISFMPAMTQYTGTEQLPIQPHPEAIGLEVVSCTLAAAAGRGQILLEAATERPIDLHVAWHGNLTIEPLGEKRQAGPQKQTPYPIQVTNHGNARAVVSWSMAQRPGDDWQVLLPEAITLDVGETEIVNVVVATPFQNGYNRGDTDFTVRAVASAFADPAVQAEPQDVPLKSSVRGWYVPGPSLGLMLVAVAGAVILTRKKA